MSFSWSSLVTVWIKWSLSWWGGHLWPFQKNTEIILFETYTMPYQDIPPTIFTRQSSKKPLFYRVLQSGCQCALLAAASKNAFSSTLQSQFFCGGAGVRRQWRDFVILTWPLLMGCEVKCIPQFCRAALSYGTSCSGCAALWSDLYTSGHDCHSGSEVTFVIACVSSSWSYFCGGGLWGPSETVLSVCDAVCRRQHPRRKSGSRSHCEGLCSPGLGSCRSRCWRELSF